MICLECVKKYCNEDITNIENYELAMSDNSSTWDCHHRKEIIVENGEYKIAYSKSELKKLGLYYNRPAEELIFLPYKKHLEMHGKSKHHTEDAKRRIGLANKNNVATRCNAEMRRKVSEWNKAHPTRSFLGKHHTEESKKLLSENHKGICKNKKWFNNGVEERMDFTCPEGFVSGRLFHNRNDKNKHWYTDGVHNVRSLECPDGYELGRTVKGRKEK